MSSEQGGGFHEPSHAERDSGAQVRPIAGGELVGQGGQVHEQGAQGHEAHEGQHPTRGERPWRRFFREKRKAVVLGAAAAVAAVGAFAGFAATSGGGAPDTSRPPGISQQAERHIHPSLESQTESVLRNLHIDSPDRLVVNQAEALKLARHAIGAAEGTAFTDLSGGEVGKRLKELSAMTPQELLQAHVYSFASEQANTIFTTIGVGKGDAWDPNQPSLLVTFDFDSTDVTVQAYIDQHNKVLPFKTPFSNDVIPDYHPNDPNPPANNIFTQLTSIIGDNPAYANYEYTGVDRSASGVTGVVSPAAFYTDASNPGLSISLDTTGSLSQIGPSSFRPDSFRNITRVSTPLQAAEVVAFASVQADVPVSQEALAGIPDLDQTAQSNVIAVSKEGLSKMPTLVKGDGSSGESS